MVNGETVLSWLMVRVNSPSAITKQYTLCNQRNMTHSTTRSLKDIYDYASKAINTVDDKHPHSDEIKQLLIDQVNDELHDYNNTTVPH